MRTIRAVFQNGALKPLEPMDLAEDTQVTVAFLEGDDLPGEAMAELAGRNKALEFLDDPREDLYTDADGQAV
jgi:predicted DNA-binding antitoxin AbrB/MazE fold protein